MTGMLRVDHGGLAAAATELVSTARRIEADLDRLEQDLAGLRADWSGSAKAAYDQARARWNAAMQEMFVMLGGLGSAVQESDAAYRAADQRGAGRFGG